MRERERPNEPLRPATCSLEVEAKSGYDALDSEVYVSRFRRQRKCPKLLTSGRRGARFRNLKDAKTLSLGIEPFAISDLHLLLITTPPHPTLHTAAARTIACGFLCLDLGIRLRAQLASLRLVAAGFTQLLASPLDTLAVIRSSQLRVIRSSTTPHRRTSRLVPVKSGESTPPLPTASEAAISRPHFVAYGREKRGGDCTARHLADGTSRKRERRGIREQQQRQ